jgi:hypothetical protein
LRLDPKTHEAATAEAVAKGKRLNKLAAETIREAAIAERPGSSFKPAKAGLKQREIL